MSAPTNIFIETRESVRNKLSTGEYITREHGGRSIAWKGFLAIITKEGVLIKFVSCKQCGEVFTYKGHSSGTSTLKKHLMKCPMMDIFALRTLMPHPDFGNLMKKEVTGYDEDDFESKGAAMAGSSSYVGYSDNASGGENAQCDDVSVDLSPDQILGDDCDASRTSITPPTQRPESFKLSHNNHLSIVLDSLASDESFMDVTLTAQGKPIKAHKSVLSAVSPYFKSVLRENPCQHPIIIMPRDITFEQLKNIIAYVYKGEMTVAASELSNLLKTAELLQVSGLSPSETGNSFADASNSPQEPISSKWMDYSSPIQRLVKTPVKTTKPASKKRPVTPSRSSSPPPKRIQKMEDSNSEFTCVKEELHSGNEFEEVDYPPANSGVDDPGENSASFSIPSEASIDSEERTDQTDPLHIPKTEISQDTVFECAYCVKSFISKADQEIHMRTKHPNKQICVCSCGKSFETPVELEDHKQTCLMI